MNQQLLSSPGSHFHGFFQKIRPRKSALGLHSSVVVAASKKEGNNSGKFNGNENRKNKTPHFSIAFPGGSSEIETPVPWDQQPINEFNSLQDSKYFSWALESVWLYSMKIGGVAACCCLLGWPVASLSINPESDFWKCGVGALSAGLMAATLAALRLYLGWAHVGNRLFSVSVEYEETGWYDGQTWIKPPEVLARDRLLGSFTVKPALDRVKITLIGLAISLSICTFLLFLLPQSRPPQALQRDGNEALHSFTTDYKEDSARHFEPEAFS